MITIRRVVVEDILALRHGVLRAGLPLETAHFDGDALATTIHVAAYEGATVVGCASWMLNEFAGEPAFQLRGMAVDGPWRGGGIGQQLLHHSEGLLAGNPVGLRWCNARLPAVGFYERQGWTAVSPVFDIPTAGPHRKMTRRRDP